MLDIFGYIKKLRYSGEIWVYQMSQLQSFERTPASPAKVTCCFESSYCAQFWLGLAVRKDCRRPQEMSRRRPEVCLTKKRQRATWMHFDHRSCKPEMPERLDKTKLHFDLESAIKIQ